MRFFKELLSDNRADLHMERMVGIAIAFVAGGLLIGAILYAMNAHYASGLNSNIHSFLN